MGREAKEATIGTVYNFSWKEPSAISREGWLPRRGTAPTYYTVTAPQYGHGNKGKAELMRKHNGWCLFGPMRADQ